MNTKLSAIYYKHDLGKLREIGAPMDEYDSEAEKLANLYSAGKITSLEDIENITREQIAELYESPIAQLSVNTRDLSVELWQELIAGSEQD